LPQSAELCGFYLTPAVADKYYFIHISNNVKRLSRKFLSLKFAPKVRLGCIVSNCGTQAKWQVITLPTSELHRHFMTEFQPKSRSIIITDMLHRPAQLLCILSGFYRSMPLLQ